MVRRSGRVEVSVVYIWVVEGCEWIGGKGIGYARERKVQGNDGVYIR